MLDPMQEVVSDGQSGKIQPKARTKSVTFLFQSIEEDKQNVADGHEGEKIQGVQNGKLSSSPMGQSIDNQIILNGDHITEEERTPLDGTLLRAINDKISTADVMKIIRDNPDLCNSVDKHGNFPLHLACSYVSSTELLQLLIKNNPKAIETKNAHGQLPLHCAVSFNHAVKVVTFLTKVNPHALEVPDGDGNLPIHCAATYNNVFILKLCLKRRKYLYTTAVRNFEGNLPIHLSALHNATCDNARLLIKYNPYSLHVRNEHDDLPVHLAVFYNTSKEVVKFLAMHSPDGLLTHHSIHELLDSRLVKKFSSRNASSGSIQKLHNKGSRQIHICGASMAGKSVLAYWLQRKIAQSNGNKQKDNNIVHSFAHSILSLTNKFVKNYTYKIPVESRTEGVNVNRVRHINLSASQQVEYVIYDYSGKEEYLLNHARFLSTNDSIYIVVVALYDLELNRLRSFEEILADYLTWLQYIYSTANSYDQMNQNDEDNQAYSDSVVSSAVMGGLLNVRTKQNSEFGFGASFYSAASAGEESFRDRQRLSKSSRVVPSYDDRNRTRFSDIESSSGLDAGFNKEVLNIPILTVVNTFAEYTKDLITPQQVDDLVKNLLLKAKEFYQLPEEIFTRARFATTVSNAVESDLLAGIISSRSVAQINSQEHASNSLSISTDIGDSSVINLQRSDDLIKIISVLDSPVSNDDPIYKSFSTSLERMEGGVSNHNMSTSMFIDDSIVRNSKAPVLNQSIYEKSFNFFDPVVLNAEDKSCMASFLPSFYNANNFIYSKVSTGLKKAMLHIEKSLDKKPMPVIMQKSNYVMQLRKRLSTLHALYQMKDIFFFNLIVEVLADCVFTSFEKSGRILVVSNQMHKLYNPQVYQYNINPDQDIRHSNRNAKITEDIVITDPFYVTNNIFNAILSKLNVMRDAENYEDGIKSYILSRKNIDSILNRNHSDKSSSNFYGLEGFRNSSSNLLKTQNANDSASSLPFLPLNKSNGGSTNNVFASAEDDDHSLLQAITTTELMEVGGYLIPIEFDPIQHILYCPGLSRKSNKMNASLSCRSDLSSSSSLTGLESSTQSVVGDVRRASSLMRASMILKSLVNADSHTQTDKKVSRTPTSEKIFDSQDNKQDQRLIKISQEERYLLFGIITTEPPAHFLSIYLLPTHTTILSSYFLLKSQQYSFIPGFFLKFFYMILSMDNFRNDFIYVYKNAIVIEIHRKQVDGGEEALVYKKQIIIHPIQIEQRLGFQLLIGITPGKNVHNDMDIRYDNHKNYNVKSPASSPGRRGSGALFTNSLYNIQWCMIFFSNLANSNGQYNVTQFATYYDETYTKHSDPAYAASNDGKYHRTIVERDGNKIKKFLNSNIWNLELEEIPLQAERAGDDMVPIVHDTQESSVSPPATSVHAETFAVDI